MATSPDDFSDAKCPINVYADAFLPFDRVENPVPLGETSLTYHAFGGDGDGRGFVKGGSARMYTDVTVDLCSEDPLLGEEHDTGESEGYYWGYEFVDEYPWVDYEEKIDTAKADTDGMNASVTNLDDCSVEIKIDGEASLPLVPGAPAIDYHYTVELSCSEDDLIEYEITGHHCGYPAYAIYIEEDRVYGFDRTDEQTKLSLFGVGEWSIDDAETPPGTGTARVEHCDCGHLASAMINAVDFESSDEVVEIQNLGSEELDLAHWTLEDETGYTVRFAESTVLDAGDTATVSLQSDARLEETREVPMLNDEGGDAVDLKNGAGDTISRFGYEIEEIDRANDDETYHVFQNSTGRSDETHWVEYDCGHRPAADHRSAPVGGVASCGHCRSWTRRDVTVTMAWTEVTSTDSDGSQETLNRNGEETLEDVDEGEFYSRWSSRA